MTWRIPVEWKWPFKLALISHKMPRLSKMSISVYAQTQEPCLNSNMKKADISFPFRRWIQIPDVQHESSALHLLASMKIKTVEKSKQLIRAAVWRLDLTGWWRRGQLHLVITYLFSLISSAFISYIWKQRNVKGWYGGKKPWVIPVLRSVIFWQSILQNRVHDGPDSREEYSIHINWLWKRLNLPLPVLLLQGVWPKLSPWQLTHFLWFQVGHARWGVVNGLFVVLVQCHHLCKVLIHLGWLV